MGNPVGPREGDMIVIDEGEPTIVHKPKPAPTTKEQLESSATVQPLQAALLPIQKHKWSFADSESCDTTVNLVSTRFPKHHKGDGYQTACLENVSPSDLRSGNNLGASGTQFFESRPGNGPVTAGSRSTESRPCGIPTSTGIRISDSRPGNVSVTAGTLSAELRLDKVPATPDKGFNNLSSGLENIDPSQPVDSPTMPARGARTRDASPPPEYDEMNRLPEWVEGNVILRPNKCIELDDEDFFRIKIILQDPRTTQVFFRGWRFRRIAHMNGLIRNNMNEVCLVFDLAEGEKVVDDKPFRIPDGGVGGSEQGLEYIELHKFRRVRKLILTNKLIPEHNFKTTRDKYFTAIQVREESFLVCRCKFVVFYPQNQHQLNSWTEKAVIFLRWAEADPCCRIPDYEMRSNWRGETIKGGSETQLTEGEETRNEGRTPVRVHPNSKLENRTHSTPCPDGGANPSQVTTSNLQGSPGLSGRKRNDNGHQQALLGSCGPGSRKTSPIDVDSDLPNLQKRQRQNGGKDSVRRNLKISYESRNTNIKAKYRFAALSLTDSEDDVQETQPPRKLIDKGKSSLAFPDVQRNKKPRTPMAESPEVYEVRITDKSRMGTFETRVNINHSYSPAPVLSPGDPGEASSHIAHTVLAAATKGQRKRSFDEVDIMEITAEKFRANSGPCTPRTPLSDNPFVFKNPQPFNSNGSKFVGSQNMRKTSHDGSAVLAEARPTTHHDPLSPPRRQMATPRARSHRASTIMSPLTPPKPNNRMELKQISRYTFGDAFCGAGGASRGAKMAGLKIKWGFDSDQHAIQTYAMNFSPDGAYANHSLAHDFVALEKDDHKVDILHISPPCQTFSPAHTIVGQNDDPNSAALFCIDKVVEKARPRIATLEQTSGIVERHCPHFHAVVNMFTSNHFSVRWRLVNMLEYGLTQTRKRLVMIASCPGELLPHFPPKTHLSTAPMTVNQVIGNLPWEPFMHQVEKATVRDRLAWNGDGRLPATITCSGGGNVHPSGTRDFTLREFACLQGFPRDHLFSQTGTKKQIGNAVPPVVAKKIYEEIVKFLKQVDGI